MGSRHKALLISTGGGRELHELEKNRYQNDLNGFLRSSGISDEVRGSALSHFDIGYEDGYSGDSPYYNEDWDEPMGHETGSA